MTDPAAEAPKTYRQMIQEEADRRWPTMLFNDIELNRQKQKGVYCWGIVCADRIGN